MHYSIVSDLWGRPDCRLEHLLFVGPWWIFPRCHTASKHTCTVHTIVVQHKRKHAMYRVADLDRVQYVQAVQHGQSAHQREERPREEMPREYWNLGEGGAVAVQNLLCWLACYVHNGPPSPKFQIPPSQLRQPADRAAGLSVKGLWCASCTGAHANVHRSML